MADMKLFHVVRRPRQEGKAYTEAMDVLLNTDNLRDILHNIPEHKLYEIARIGRLAQAALSRR